FVSLHVILCITVAKKGNKWATLFPREIKTHQQSLVMVKRIMAVAVSGITYLRGIFPEDAYSTHYLEDLCVKVLREDSIYPRVSKIVKWYVHN
uniref:HORMA domain-containing protein n=1 Tax=Chrysemys picta bellii TaxID=8478 RepID=A0A8C3FDS0_CHRPI